MNEQDTSIASPSAGSGDVPLSGGCSPHRVGQRWGDYAVSSAGAASDVMGSSMGLMAAIDPSEKVAAVGDLPFVVGLDEDRAGQSQQRLGIGEDADDIGTPLDLLVQPLQRVGRPDLLPMRHGKPLKASRSSSDSRSIASTARN